MFKKLYLWNYLLLRISIRIILKIFDSILIIFYVN